MNWKSKPPHLIVNCVKTIQNFAYGVLLDCFYTREMGVDWTIFLKSLDYHNLNNIIVVFFIFSFMKVTDGMNKLEWASIMAQLIFSLLHTEDTLTLRVAGIMIDPFHPGTLFSRIMPSFCRPNQGNYLVGCSLICWLGLLDGPKDWAVKKVTIPNSTSLMVKSSEIILFFYLHFTWLCGH